MEMYTVSVYDAVTGDDQQDVEVFESRWEAEQFALDIASSYGDSDWSFLDGSSEPGGACRVVLAPPGYGNEHVIVLDVSYTEVES